MGWCRPSTTISPCDDQGGGGSRINTPSVNARSFHADGANVARLDGSARFIKIGIGPVTRRAISTRAGGEVVSADQP